MDTAALTATLTTISNLWAFLDDLKYSNPRRERLRPMKPSFHSQTPGGTATELDIDLSRSLLAAAALTCELGGPPLPTTSRPGLIYYLTTHAGRIVDTPGGEAVIAMLDRIQSQLMLYIQPGEAKQNRRPQPNLRRESN